MVGDFPVTDVSELEKNPQCAEGIENLSDIGGSGYYDCGLWGTFLIMDKVLTDSFFQIMEIKAWSWDHLNQHADPALVTSSNGPTNVVVQRD